MNFYRLTFRQYTVLMASTTLGTAAGVALFAYLAGAVSISVTDTVYDWICLFTGSLLPKLMLRQEQ